MVTNDLFVAFVGTHCLRKRLMNFFCDLAVKGDMNVPKSDTL